MRTLPTGTPLDAARAVASRAAAGVEAAEAGSTREGFPRAALTVLASFAWGAAAGGVPAPDVAPMLSAACPPPMFRAPARGFSLLCPPPAAGGGDVARDDLADGSGKSCTPTARDMVATRTLTHAGYVAAILPRLLRATGTTQQGAATTSTSTRLVCACSTRRATWPGPAHVRAQTAWRDAAMSRNAAVAHAPILHAAGGELSVVPTRVRKCAGVVEAPACAKRAVKWHRRCLGVRAAP